MHILLTAAGTRGDVQPLLALGRQLITRGHRVQLAAAPCFADDAHAVGLSFAPMGRDIEAWLTHESASIGHNPISLWRLLNRAVSEEMNAQFRVLPELARGCDAVVAAGALIAGSSAAAAANVPFHYVAYTNQSIPSNENVPSLMPFQGLPRWANRLCWSLTTRFYDRLLLAEMNTHRRALGLAPAHSMIDVFLPARRLVLAADSELSPPPSDVPVPTTGAWHLDDRRPLPATLEAFLDAGPAPIFAGFGSMPDRTPSATGAMFASAAEMLGVRVVIGGRAVCAPSRDVFVLEGPVSHAQLFPRMAAVVHHGGAGTTATAARAGVPHVIVPHGGDQFGFGRRVAELGVGSSPVPRARLTKRRLVEALTTALSRAATAKTLGARLSSRADGTSLMARHIEADLAISPQFRGKVQRWLTT